MICLRYVEQVQTDFFFLYAEMKIAYFLLMDLKFYVCAITCILFGIYIIHCCFCMSHTEMINLTVIL